MIIKMAILLILLFRSVVFYILSVDNCTASFLSCRCNCRVSVVIFMREGKVKVSQYNKLDKKDSVHIEVATKDSNGWKYKKLEDAESDSSDSTTTDVHA